jgi:hypothetical protein
MKEISDLVRGWIVKADSDLEAMRLLIANKGPYDKVVAKYWHIKSSAAGKLQ